MAVVGISGRALSAVIFVSGHSNGCDHCVGVGTARCDDADLRQGSAQWPEDDLVDADRCGCGCLDSAIRLVARFRILPKDIGHLDPGHPVQVKVSAHDFGRYSAIDGHLSRPSPATFNDEAGTYYSGENSLEQYHAGSDTALRPISPGMQVSADIVTGSKSILSYQLQPIFSSLSVALTERQVAEKEVFRGKNSRITGS